MVVCVCWWSDLQVGEAHKIWHTALYKLPSPFHKAFNLRSHHKCCNTLVTHICHWALSLLHAGPTLLADVFVAHFLFADSIDPSQSDAYILMQILDHEFSCAVMTHFSQDSTTGTGKVRAVRWAELKLVLSRNQRLITGSGRLSGLLLCPRMLCSIVWMLILWALHKVNHPCVPSVLVMTVMSFLLPFQMIWSLITLTCSVSQNT